MLLDLLGLLVVEAPVVVTPVLVRTSGPGGYWPALLPETRIGELHGTAEPALMQAAGTVGWPANVGALATIAHAPTMRAVGTVTWPVLSGSMATRAPVAEVRAAGAVLASGSVATMAQPGRWALRVETTDEPPPRDRWRRERARRRR